MARICLITPHHISFQPRALREADSLQEAGHEVRVVCRHTDPFLTAKDQRLKETKKWRLQAVDQHRNGPNQRAWFIESIQVEIFKRAFRLGMRSSNFAARGYVKGLGRLIALATAEPADWYIAHTQMALPIAAVAARRWKARLGFDCEDLLADLDADRSDLVRLIELSYLPLCDYVSAPSQCLADRLVQDYSIRSPIILYNVHPLHLAEGLLPPQQRPMREVMRLHWFGQTLGPGRGIEEAIEAAGLLGQGVELHLRGRVPESYRSTIDELARRYGAEKNIVFHPTVDPDDLIGTMNQFDVGLALERPEHPNYSLAATNKIMSYFLAGLAVAATDTPGHREVLERFPSAGFLYPAGNRRALVEGLYSWLNNRNGLRAAQHASWNAARQRFCWDIEKAELLQVIESDLSKSFGQVAYSVR